MTLEEKTALLADVLEIDAADLKPETELETLPLWDSLAKLALIAMFAEDFGQAINIAEVRKLQTVNDIFTRMD